MPCPHTCVYSCACARSVSGHTEAIILSELLTSLQQLRTLQLGHNFIGPGIADLVVIGANSIMPHTPRKDSISEAGSAANELVGVGTKALAAAMCQNQSIVAVQGNFLRISNR